ncbi:MAG: DUF1963 domain-containing protein [Bacteroidales bacterium]|nr:DUF1963 domain-containing protein [Bacteroidales bacterium]
MANEEFGKLRKWVSRIFKRPASEESTNDRIMEDLRKAKTFPQFLGVVFHPRNLSLTTVIFAVLLVLAYVFGSVSHFIKFLILFVSIEGFLFVSYFRYWKSYKALLEAQKEHNSEVDESMVETIRKEMGKMRKDTIRLDLTFSEGNDHRAGHSRYGGCPDVPEGFEWPCDDAGRPLSLLFQLDCAELSKYDKESLLPTSGHLYFFYELSEMNWEGTENSIRVLYYDKTAGPLHRCEYPDSLQPEYRLKESSLRLSEGDSYPRYEDLLPIIQNWEWVDEYAFACQRLLYFPDQWNGSFLGYDNPIQESILTDLQDDVLLLQFNSIETGDEYELIFGDCGALYFVISREDLLARKFDNIRFDMQCC